MKSKKYIPPRLAQKILFRLLRDDLVEEVIGDLDEKFYLTIKNRSLFKARLNYWYQVLHYMRPFAIRKSKFVHSNHYPMFQSYFKIGWRNLLKNKGYSFINIGGLTAGMVVAVFIGMWIYDEVSFNTYHTNHRTIARVMRTGTLNGETFTTHYLPYALGEELKTKYGSSFTKIIMAWSVGDHILSVNDKKQSYLGEFIESGAPEMFSLKMIKGNWSGLKDPHSILISASLAKSFFGDEDPLNKHVVIDNRMDTKVTGVYEDLPHNTHFQGVKFFAPWDLLVSVSDWMKSQGFKNNFLDIYVEIQPSTDFEKASSYIKKAIVNNIQDDKEYVAANPEIFLHPMDKWHLRSEWKNGVNVGGLIQYVWLFGIVGAFVLLLACINFMNLSTARSENRMKEVGVRKVIGSSRKNLISQFFSESFLVVIIAFIFSLLVVFLLLDWFNVLAAKQMMIPWSNPYFWFISFGFILFTGFLAGSYPALYLSSFQPIRVLKGTFRLGKGASIPRRVLVVIQFTVSVTLILGTIIVYQQIQFAKKRSVGYTRDGLLLIQMASSEFYGKHDVLQTELKNTGAVIEIAESASPVTGVWSSNGGFNWTGKDPNLQTEFATLTVTPEYGKTVGWQFLKGRDFSTELASDSSGFIINETGAKLIGFENPIGEIIQWSPVWRKAGSYKIIGVIKDMVMESPFAPVMPTVFFLDGNVNWINIKINPAVETHEALSKIESVFKKVIPGAPFNYKFADQEYALKFTAEERIGKLASVFGVLAIFISCLGLFALASFVAEQRTKEIGIRKVLGASMINLWQMLSKDFIVLVLISCLISVPIAFYTLNNWLQNYAYHTDISWWIFLLVILGALVITLFTVSFQAIRVALMNPVNSLKAE